MRAKKYAAVFATVVLGATTMAALSAGSVQASAKGLIAEVTAADGTALGTVRIVGTEDGKTKVSANLQGLAPGFHGFHVHSVGTCDPAAQDPNGVTIPFLSAGGHFNPVTTNTHGAHAGDLPSVLVAEDGTAMLRFKTDRFRPSELMDTDGSALIVHAGPDNFAHIPATTSTGGERYHSHFEDVFGADSASKATGDAGARFACGQVVKAAG